MSTLTEHAKSILRAIADGKTIEYKHWDTSWVVNDSMVRLGDLIDGGKADKLRIAPETRSINGVVFAAPLGPTTEGKRNSSYGFNVDNEMFFWDARSDCDSAKTAILDALNGVEA